jgi:predicted RNA binding protein YcfA (HicA-like mRNA interferase family)
MWATGWRGNWIKTVKNGDADNSQPAVSANAALNCWRYRLFVCFTQLSIAAHEYLKQISVPIVSAGMRRWAKKGCALRLTFDHIHCSKTCRIIIWLPMKVRELLQADGWFLVRTKGSHRQFKHPRKKGLVTVPDKPGDELALGTLNSILKQAGFK